MLKVWTAAIVALSFAAVLAATNPTDGDHRRVVVERSRASCSNTLFIKALCGDVLDYAASHLRYDDWRLFSIGQVGPMETFGVLGTVVVVRE
jgi:hypothetical protein